MTDMNIPTEVPVLITAGTTVKFRRSFSDYPASDGWSYSIYLSGPAVLAKTAAVVDGVFETTLATTDTVILSAGTYRYSEIVTKGTDKYEAERGVIEVQLDLVSAFAGDAQTHAEKTLSVIEAALSGRMSDDVQSYQIAGRLITKIPVTELMKLRGHYASLVWRQRNPGKLGPQAEVQFG